MDLSVSIYKITHKDSGKTYIGQTLDTKRRWTEHGKPSIDTYISRAIRKYGRAAFEYTVIDVVCQMEANEKEIAYIHAYNSLVPNGYNLSLLMTGGSHSEETKAKISASNKGKVVSMETREKMRQCRKDIVITEETRRKLSLANIGSKNYFYGTGNSQVCVAQYNLEGEFEYIYDNAHKAIIQLTNYQEDKLDSLDKRLRIAAKNNRKLYNKFWCFVNEGSEVEKTKAFEVKIPKIRDVPKNSKPVIQKSLTGEKISEYSSTKQAGRVLDIPHQNIARCCKKGTKTAGGYIWEYLDEVSNVQTDVLQIRVQKSSSILKFLSPGAKVA